MLVMLVMPLHSLPSLCSPFTLSLCRTVVPTPVSTLVSYRVQDAIQHSAEGRKKSKSGWTSLFLRLDESKIKSRIIRELFGGPLRLIEPAMLARTYRIAKSAWTVERRNNFRSHVARFRNSLSLLARIFFSGRRSQSLVSPFFSRPRSGYFLSFFSLLLGIRFPLSGSWKASERYPRANSLFPFRYRSRLSNRVWLNRV